MPGLDLFMKYLTEAPDDAPPDAGMSDSGGNDPPPDMTANDDPPSIDMGDGGDMGDDIPPDMEDDSNMDDGGFGDDSFSDEGSSGGEDENTSPLEGLDEKISAILNMKLYQRYLTLLNNIASQLSMVKDNSDILHTISPDALNIIDSLKKLDENIRLYLKNTFINENYSKNLLFFNKCLNLLDLLNQSFNDNIKHGINSMK